MLKNICVKKGRSTSESSGPKSRTDEIEISYTDTQSSPPFEHIDIRPGLKMIMARGPLQQGLKMEFDIEHAPVSFTYSLAQRVRCTIKTGAGKGHTVTRSPGDAIVAYLPATRGSVEVSPSQAGWGLSLHFSIDTFNALFRETPRCLGRIGADPRTGKRFFHQSRFGGETLMAIKQLLECPHSGEIRRLYMEAKAMELVALKLSELNAPASDRSGPFSRRDLDRAREAHHILLTCLADPPDLIELSRRVGVNRNKLNRCFRQLYGNTVFGVLRDARLAKAKSLLARTELSLAEISFKVGYNNQANFTTAFRRKFGLTPGAARLEPGENTMCIRQ